MKFDEFVKSKKTYILVDSFGPVRDGNNDTYETSAVSPVKAKSQILHRIRNSPRTSKGFEILINPSDYNVILKSDWLDHKAKKEHQKTKDQPLPQRSPINPNQQGELFNRRWE